MFHITEEPSSGSLVQCLTKNYKNDSILSVYMDKVGVMAAYCDHNYVGCSESKERLCIQPAQLFHCTRSVIWCVQ